MKLELKLPDKLFGLETALLTTFVPTFVLVVVMLASANLIIMPKINDYQQVRADVERLTEEEKVLNEKIVYLQSINTEELRKNADFITTALLPQKNAYILVEVVRKVADKFTFQIDSFMISPGKLTAGNSTEAVAANTVSTIPIELTLVGPASKYLDLIKGLEKSLPVLSLSKFEMRNEQEMAKLEIEITAYYLEEKSNYDISKLTLADLAMKREETELLTKLNEFQILGNVAEIEQRMGLKREYKKYDRKDPFSL